jgi:hypothetical protein
MAVAATLEALFQQVEAMQACLASGDTAGTGRLLLLHDHDLHQFLSDQASLASNADALGELLAAQRGVIDLMVATREGARLQLQASRQNDRAARAYLANSES